MKQLKIEIKGTGTRQQIAEALVLLASSIADPAKDIDELAEAGIEWENATLMTCISTVDEETAFSPSEAIEAITALLDGVWDNEQLMKVGALHIDEVYNIRSILESTVPDSRDL